MTTLVSRGLLRTDGCIELLDLVELPSKPCEVMVTIVPREPALDSPPSSPTNREPGGFWLDESISAPFDLPHSGPFRRVQARRVSGPYLPPNPIFPLVPEPIFWEAEDSK